MIKKINYLKKYISKNNKNAIMLSKLLIICNILDVVLIIQTIMFKDYLDKLDFSIMDIYVIIYIYFFIIIEVITINLWNFSISYTDLFYNKYNSNNLIYLFLCDHNSTNLDDFEYSSLYDVANKYFYLFHDKLNFYMELYIDFSIDFSPFYFLFPCPPFFLFFFRLLIP